MKKLLSIIICSLLLVGCQSSTYNTLKINKQESHTTTTVYDLEFKNDVTLDVYDLKDSKWRLTDTVTLKADYSKLVIDLIELTNDSNQKEFYLQYYMYDGDGNERPEVYRYLYEDTEHLTFSYQYFDDIQFESENETVIALFQWSKEDKIPIKEIDLTETYDSSYAYLLVVH